jgi:hypothetical protein
MSAVSSFRLTGHRFVLGLLTSYGGCEVVGVLTVREHPTNTEPRGALMPQWWTGS